MKSYLRKHPWCSMMVFALSASFLLLPIGCAKSSPATVPSASPTTSSVSVAINPSTVSVGEGGLQPFSAAVSGTANNAVTWSVQEGATGGLITSSGSYAAPFTLGTYHVVATSVADPTKSATATVTTIPAPSRSSVYIGVTPLIAAAPEGGTLIYSASVSGAANTAVTWSVQEGPTGRLITNSGFYTAPNTLGTYHVVATSVADPTKSAVAAVTTQLQAPGGFVPVGNMTAARANHTATLLRNGKVLITGGEGDGLKALASAELYDPSTRTFTPTGSMITPRYGHSAVLMADGRVLIVGGTQDGSFYTLVLTTEIYDPFTGALTATGKLPSAGGGAALLPDGRVFVAVSNGAEIYDPQSGTFALTSAPGSPLLGIRTVTSLANGKVLVAGVDDLQVFQLGCGGFVVCHGLATQLFDPQSGTFSLTGRTTDTGAPDSPYTATLLTDGRVLFLADSAPYFGDVEVYDPATGTFASLERTVSQGGAPASRLTDGTVLIAGGSFGQNGDDTGAQLYSPASGTFEYPGPMTTGRSLNTSTPLPDDTVLITGGRAGSYPTSSAEVYKPR